MLLANRCFKWGSIDALVICHVGRTSGPGPPMSAAENLTHSAGHPGRGCPSKGGAQHTKEEENKAKKELAERWERAGEPRGQGGQGGQGLQSVGGDVWSLGGALAQGQIGSKRRPNHKG